MTVTVRETTVSVTVGGSSVDSVMSLRWSAGFDLQVGEASIVCAANPSGGYYDDVVITVNGTARWRGVLVQRDFTLFPVQVTLICRDPMYRAAQFIPPDELEDGLLLEDITGGPDTDQNIVAAVLGIAGVSDVGGIGGTSTIMGTVAPEEFVWRRNETALSYISRIDAISLGYRTYFNGSFVVRTPISIDAGSSSMTFTEAVNISRGQATRTILERYTAVRVGGYDVGDYADPRVWYVDGGGGELRVFNFESKMIERKADATVGDGMSCESVANYWIGELNRELVKVQITTPSDAFILPGQFHTISADDRLGTGQALWAQRVDGEVGPNGGVSQNIQYIGG